MTRALLDRAEARTEESSILDVGGLLLLIPNYYVGGTEGGKEFDW